MEAIASQGGIRAITRLTKDPASYLTWKDRIKLKLRRDKLWELVSGLEQQPSVLFLEEDNADEVRKREEQIEVWEGKNLKALDLIFETMDNDVFALVRDLDTKANELWEAIGRLYQRDEKSSTIRVYDEVAEFKFLGNLESDLQRYAVLMKEAEELEERVDDFKLGR